MMPSSPPFLRHTRLLLGLSLYTQLASVTSALFATGSSSAIQDPFVNPPRSVCPVAQDGTTSNTFPWTHNPTCINLVLSSSDGAGRGVHQDYCVYTNVVFASGRGISLVTTPEIAASLTAETFQPYLETEFEVPYEAKETEDRGIGLFASKDIKAGETLIKKAPALFVAKDVLASPSKTRRSLLLGTSVKQLPEKTRREFMGLVKSMGGEEVEDRVLTNGFGVKVWDGTSHLVVVPEAAVSFHRDNALRRLP